MTRSSVTLSRVWHVEPKQRLLYLIPSGSTAASVLRHPEDDATAISFANSSADMYGSCQRSFWYHPAISLRCVVMIAKIAQNHLPRSPNRIASI